MPGLDRTGPEGEGSMTGRRMGKCNPHTKKASKNSQEEEFRGERGYGRGFGRGRFRGGGRGMGRGLGRNNP